MTISTGLNPGTDEEAEVLQVPFYFGKPPPVPPDPPPPSGPQTFPEFIYYLKWLLHKITGDWRELLIPGHRRDILRKSYEELVTPQDDAFEAVAKALSDTANREKLKAAGLTGQNGEMKLSKFRELWDKFIKGGGRKWLARLLGHANKILKSIVGPTGMGEAIAELKDACEEEMKDTI